MDGLSDFLEWALDTVPRMVVSFVLATVLIYSFLQEFVAPFSVAFFAGGMFLGAVMVLSSWRVIYSEENNHGDVRQS